MSNIPSYMRTQHDEVVARPTSVSFGRYVIVWIVGAAACWLATSVPSWPI
jgi:hypothetical protein